MRELKFRAWDSISKKMWIPDFISADGLAGMSLGTKEHPNDVVYDSDRFPLMQYIGLKDKNSKEIYEGDILKWALPGSNPIGGTCWEVIFDRGAFRIPYDNSILWEVIGNIYSNPELLR